MWLILGLSFLVLFTGCATTQGLSSKFPRPVIPVEHEMSLNPTQVDCRIQIRTEVQVVACAMLLLEDMFGILKERQELRKNLLEADHTLCIINRECK